MDKKIKLDLKSRKILYELDINARQSYSKIGKKVGLSKDLVNYRIKQMEKSGLIKGYYTVLDISKLGYLNFRVFMKFYNVSPEKEKEIIGYLINHPRVGWLVSVTGRWDANILVWVESVYKFKQFWEEFLHKYRNYIDEKWISIVTEMIQYKKAFLLGKKSDDSEPEVVGGELERNVDETDLKILEVLSSDARASLLDISKNIKVSPKVVDYRIKRMIKDKIILSFRALLDLHMLGIVYYKMNFTLHNMTDEKEKELLEYAKIHPNIVITALTVGGANFEIEVYAESNKQFHEIRSEMRERFYDIIRSIETMEYFKEYKWIYLPIE